MKEIRSIGFFIEESIKNKKNNLSNLLADLKCSSEDLNMIMKGRKFLSYKQLEIVANHINVDINEILNGKDSKYDQSFVHCMTDFSDLSNREQILDDIYDFLDLLDLTHKEA